MGAKRLKAIAVRGTRSVKIARTEEFKEAAGDTRKRILAADKAARTPGAIAEPRERNLQRGCLPAKNYQTGILPLWMETRGQDIARKYFTKKDGACYACPIPCFNLAEVNEGKYAGLKVNRCLMSGVVGDWGAKCAIDNMPAIWKCKELCQQLGMDYSSAAGCISRAGSLPRASTRKFRRTQL